MLITDKFILLNFPKTGSSFVRNIIKRIHPVSPTEKVLQKIGFRKAPYQELYFKSLNIYGSEVNIHHKHQHGTFSQIPQNLKSKNLVSVARHPFDLIVSKYSYEWYKKKPVMPVEKIKLTLPNFPNLSFKEYLVYMNDLCFNKILNGVNLDTEIGLITLQFIMFYAYNPIEVLNKINDSYIHNNEFIDDFPKVNYLKTESLNDDLYNFLKEQGYSNERIEFIKNENPINISKKRKRKSWSEFISGETAEELKYKERMLFKIFPEYN